ncbi:MAG: phosphodiester glycosidase family protein, partial [Clostridia bacterium]|nr:phosphodiester glycosidase family protein [Clostridia bacterium]
MKLPIRIISLALCALMLMSLGVATVSAAPAAVTGAAKTDSETIKLGDVDTGVTLTQMLLSSGSQYSKSADGLLNVIEVNLSDKVTMAVLNGGDYNWSKATMGASAVEYNKTHTDGTVLAAVNGDPWIVYHTDYDGDGQKATGASVKHVSVSRGTMIIDGELWASHQINDENNLARTDNVERGTPASRGPVFAIKNDGTAMIGTPTININLINATDDKNIRADGINRLPAPNSVILYNQRCGTESFAFEDAYEIYLECEDAAFGIHKFTHGKVVAIFESGDKSTRPAIDEKTVVISARGTSISRIKGQFDIGDMVSVFCSVGSDAMNQNQATVWGEVKEAIAGFFTLMQNGQLTGQPGNTTNYPCSIIGMKKDGTVMLISSTATVDGTRNACQMTNLPSLCKELGLETAILFDGGGSTTMVSLSGDQYVRRSSAVDGSNSVRAVISGIAVVYKGVDKEFANAETKNTAYLAGLGLQAPEEPDTDGADLKVSPSYAYGYLAQVETVNGTKYDDLIGRRDPTYSSGWTSEQKAAAIQPAVLPEAELTEDGKLI